MNHLYTRGFTLIEILIVISIISIISGTAIYTFGDFGSQRKTIATAEHLVSYIKLIQQLSALEGVRIGMDLAENKLTMYRLQPDSTWATMHLPKFMHTPGIPLNTKIVLDTQIQHTPHIIFMPTGDMTPFNFLFTTKSNLKIDVIIDGRENGDIKMHFKT
ncbi:MAG: hypothetical protein A3F46_09685 [Legionellales bacterium RIFCSPHIGHO2_12_FULL_42_9]|nr:MAG: hypothetical protein A3F46_09685 [Legionellales bacterium RIFCSPHIGHO2_12_FULL_42_9]